MEIVGIARQTTLGRDEPRERQMHRSRPTSGPGALRCPPPPQGRDREEVHGCWSLTRLRSKPAGRIAQTWPSTAERRAWRPCATLLERVRAFCVARSKAMSAPASKTTVVDCLPMRAQPCRGDRAPRPSHRESPLARSDVPSRRRLTDEGAHRLGPPALTSFFAKIRTSAEW